jgi:hypothetical protein
MEGKVPVPPFCLRAEQDDDTLPVRREHIWGAEAAGVKSPLSAQHFIRD